MRAIECRCENVTLLLYTKCVLGSSSDVLLLVSGLNDMFPGNGVQRV